MTVLRSVGLFTKEMRWALDEFERYSKRHHGTLMLTTAGWEVEFVRFLDVGRLRPVHPEPKRIFKTVPISNEWVIETGQVRL